MAVTLPSFLSLSILVSVMDMGVDATHVVRLWKSGPNFDTEVSQHVVAMEGSTARLMCTVIDANNETVSWVRHQDLHILTVDRYTYTADPRYRAVHNRRRVAIEEEMDESRKEKESWDEWMLVIRNVNTDDAGRYECQVATQPVRSFFVQLRVVAATSVESGSPIRKVGGGVRKEIDRHRVFESGSVSITRILGDGDQYVDAGSVVNLTCLVAAAEGAKALHSPSFILWFHNGNLIEYNSDEDSLSSSLVSVRTTTKASTLIIQHVRARDSGQYVCKADGVKTDTNSRINLHVLRGEHQAAIHTTSGNSASAQPSSFNFLLALITLLWMTATILTRIV